MRGRGIINNPIKSYIILPLALKRQGCRRQCSVYLCHSKAWKVIKKETLAQVFACEFRETFKDIFFFLFFFQNTSGGCFWFWSSARTTATANRRCKNLSENKHIYRKKEKIFRLLRFCSIVKLTWLLLPF